jgi:predicted nuclease of predicted toxin-antitoxin system
MAAAASKSKKRSDASSRSPHEPLVFFTDTNLGRYIIPNAIRAAGETVRVHDEVFEAGTPDTVWLHQAGKEGWVVLTKDSKIRYRSNETEALFAAKVRAFVLVSSNLPGSEIAKIFVAALPAIKRHCRKHPPPFIAHVYRSGEVVLRKSRE